MKPHDEGYWKTKMSATAPIVEPKNMTDEELLEVGFTQENIDVIRHRTAPSDPWSNETQEETVSRLALCACLNCDVIFRGVRNGLCYFDVYYESEGHDGPKVTLSVPTEKITAETIGERIKEWDGSRSRR